MPQSIPVFYDPENFAEVTSHFAQMIRDYMSKAMRGDMPVLRPQSPEVLLKEWSASAITPEGITRAEGMNLLEKAIKESMHLHHPHYMGHQVTCPLPLAILCDMATSMLNNSSAVYEMGQVATAMEISLLQWISRLIGYSAGAGGIITSGGSVGNLTALLAARQIKCQGNVWKDGFTDGEARPSILVSEQAHYCIKRATQIMGMGEGGAIAVASDVEYRMDIKALKAAYTRAKDEGRQVIAVAASACTTATGTYDPLMEIADFCEEHDLWMHVDGAHGLAALLSHKYKDLLKGVARADSAIWDLHKMLLMPSLLTAVVYKGNEDAYQAFAQEASYIFNNSEMEAYNFGLRTLECTKPMSVLKAYISLVSYGTDAFGGYIDHCFDLGKYFAAELRLAADFEVAVEPDCNIVCFRYIPAQIVPDLDALQLEIRTRLIDSGEFYIVQTKLRGVQYLRVTLINPLTSKQDIALLMQRIREIAAR